MTPNGPPLIVVDVQNGFIYENTYHVVPRIVDLVRRWPGPVVFTRFHNVPGSNYERLIGWRRLQGPPDTDLAVALQPYAQSVIDKDGYTFFSAEGRQLAEQQGWTDIYFCGIDTDICVLKSAVDAFELGFTPHVIEDACASHAGPAAHDAGVTILKRFIGRGQVVRSADLSIDRGLTVASPPSVDDDQLEVG